MYQQIRLFQITRMICNRLLNKFDTFIIIEGKRGLGKSTLGIKMMKSVKRQMILQGEKGWRFSLKKDLLYSRKEVLKFLMSWKRSGMADEMINVSFNRDFYNEEQKDLIKIINMNRDHSNLFIACVPQFKTLDSQIKGLCCMKITVVRRGLSIVQMPNRSIYSKDIWDETVNEKIERDWAKVGLKNPKYSKLTTFRGYLKFKKLTPKTEEFYQEIKNEKRNIIFTEKGIVEKPDRTKFDDIYDMLVKREIKNTSMLDGLAFAIDLKGTTLKEKLKKKLSDDKKPNDIKQYFYDEKEMKIAEKETKRNALIKLIDDVTA